jgi:O-antigen/teichoic acid export membrane protein
VMFPQTSKLHAQTKNTLNVLKKSIIYVGVLSGTAALICLLFPGLIIRLLSGQYYLECVPLARIFSVTMFFFALIYVLLFYHLSIHRLDFIYSLVLLTVFQVIAITLFHETLSQVIYIMCGNAILLFLINLYLAFRWKEFHVAPGIGCNS